MTKQKDIFNPLFKGKPVKIGRRKKEWAEQKSKPGSEPSRRPAPDLPEQMDFMEAMSGVKPLPDEDRKRVRQRPPLPSPEDRREKFGRRGQDGAEKKQNPGAEHRPGLSRNAPGQDEFLDAMTGVKPLPGEPRQRVRPGELRSSPAVPAPDERREVVGHLRSLVRGAIELDITFSDEYIEGSVRGFSHELMKKLKRGEFPVQDHIDLHGLTREEAEAAIKGFILKSFRLGLRCVLIIHGRGLNSPESFPVLKEGLPIWLGRSPVKRMVLAFATARPYDGGTGAVYVLLRKR
ncbi:MAG: DNA mismatch repair protein MutS [Desulfobacteraceae bacterium]|nr:MAG: DNA mismatch repair protein MutS [Desulfobacteraceae bacterium]